MAPESLPKAPRGCGRVYARGDTERWCCSTAARLLDEFRFLRVPVQLRARERFRWNKTFSLPSTVFPIQC
eukprot:scaffold95701_cov65-Phaeocystis_antarctica.AAC.1